MERKRINDILEIQKRISELLIKAAKETKTRIVKKLKKEILHQEESLMNLLAN